MRLQLPKNADPENPHKYWVFGGCRSYEIAAEENRHVGQLQEVLKRISPNASEIEKGTTEAKDQLRFVNGKLPVQTHTPIQTQQRTNNAPVDDLSDECTLDNCDDTF